MFLLDTMVLSELRKKERNSGLVHWIGQRKDSELFVSVVTIGEIERDTCRQRAKDAVFAQKLAAWLDQLILVYADRILPVTIPITRRWGSLAPTWAGPTPTF
jgi:predicted nucleic acid-binding protein